MGRKRIGCDGSATHAGSANASPTDWRRLLEDFLGDEPRAKRAAAIAFSGVIEGKLWAIGAYDRRHSCEDLIHDVLLALLRNAHKVEQPAAWLRRATFNAYVDLIRRESVRTAKEQTLTYVQTCILQGRPSGQPDDSMLLKEEMEDLRRAIKKLPDHLREVVDVVFPASPEGEPATLAVAAETLGLDIHTLKNRQRRAIELLGKEIRRDRCLRRHMRDRDPDR